MASGGMRVRSVFKRLLEKNEICVKHSARVRLVLGARVGTSSGSAAKTG